MTLIIAGAGDAESLAAAVLAASASVVDAGVLLRALAAPVALGAVLGAAVLAACGVREGGCDGGGHAVLSVAAMA